MSRLLQAAFITSAFYLMMILSPVPAQQSVVFSPLQQSNIEAIRFRYFLARMLNLLLDPLQKDA